MGNSSAARRPYGSGSVRRAGDGRWEVRATCGRRSDGRPRTVSRTVRGTKADAEMELVRLRAEMGASPVLGDEMTLDEYFYGVFVPSREGGPRATLETYLSVYRSHIGPAFGSWPASAIRRGDVQRWARSLPTAATADKAFRHLRAILRAMWDDELLDEKPLERRVRLPRGQAAPREVWGAAEVAEAMARLRGHRAEALALAMAGGGLRREEAMALELPGDLAFADVTGLDGRRRCVCRALVTKAWAAGEPPRGTTKTYRARPVTIGEPFSSRLREAASDGRPRLLMRADGSGPMSPGSVPKLWRSLFREGGPLEGMRYVEMRTLRHAHETLAARGGLDDARNADLHGHSPDVMRSSYLSFSSADADAMAEAVRRAMGA